MVKIPSLSRRPESAQSRDEPRDETRDGRDGRSDERDDAHGATYRSQPAITPGVDRKRKLDRAPEVDHQPAVTVPAGAKPRASLLATLALAIGVTSVLFVLTGTLAGYGIGLGVLAMLVSIGGISATSRRHVAGKSDALIGLALGFGAVIVGVLALTGQFLWPATDGETVQRFREWLDAQLLDRL